MSLQNKVAVVTGAAGGLGAAVADHLGSAGARVIRADRSFSDDDWPDRVALDVADAASWDRFAARVREQAGRLDILVNNAGISMRTDVVGTADEDFARVMRVNVWGVWRGIKTFADDLTATGGCVVNVGSIYGVTTAPVSDVSPSSVAYQASKAAVHQVTKVAAVELAPRGVRVNAVLPGVFRTGLLADLPPDELQVRVGGAPLGRPGDTAELGPVVALLAGPGASFITGALIPVDGGYLAAS
ncbi:MULTISPECIES: SDR family NAD(P)-dependent oxidoreductase [Streptomyces]|uniref:SDR family NAD(P)-dependent oxidoreductase n=1 Tax=Streptomyces mordarskii TaxID=1226758 RepID=A0ABP3PA03_9ACTN|nr:MULTISPECIES: SDR family oxidoreductase [Streptomyces]QTI89572.1 SDR family oxidoreductase [Streptomyces sp. AgN23]RSS48924.1 SDR family oxidoreductase [Streptomyces sp. WAC05858]WTA80456.1 SDR family oxidoreductase [Streptomyces antimycoticus]